jgi:hypothetical protein
MEGGSKNAAGRVPFPGVEKISYTSIKSAQLVIDYTPGIFSYPLIPYSVWTFMEIA